jgi:hypothetical protein
MLPLMEHFLSTLYFGGKNITSKQAQDDLENSVNYKLTLFSLISFLLNLGKLIHYLSDH